MSDTRNNPTPEISFVEEALRWYTFGFRVIPIKPNTKITAVKWDPWLEDLSPEKIRNYWAEHPNYEIGLIVSDDLIVFDADSPKAIVALGQIEEAFDLVPSLTVKTSRGAHHYFRRAIGAFAKTDAHSTAEFPERIDVKASRSMVVLPPSKNKSVDILEAETVAELSEAGQDLIDAVFRHNGRKPPRPVDKTRIAAKPLLENSDKVIRELQAMLQHVDPDCGYGDWFRVLAALFHATGGSEDGLAIADAWSARGEKYPGPDEIAAKWGSFGNYDGDPVTIATIRQMLTDAGVDWMEVCAAAEPGFEPTDTTVTTIETPDEGAAQDVEADPLAAIQEDFALINLDGRVWVFDRKRFAASSAGNSTRSLTLSTRSDGALLIKRDVRRRFPELDAKKVVGNFFESPDTVCYRGVEFNPAGTTEGFLNLWTGPSTTPRKGNWSLIRQFLLDVVCDGDEASLDYLLGYIAHALQYPEIKPGVEIELLGGQGSGKGTFGRLIHEVWGPSYLQVHDIKAVTGNFNASLEQTLWVFMDEALFTGDRKSTDALKSLVTEPLIHVNQKHQPARQMRSYHRFIAATNAAHFKHTERDDRRSFVLRLSEARRGDHAYWQALHQQIVSGGAAAMMYDLLALDLSNFNVRQKPQTAALLDQKLRSLDPIPHWWYECLERGEVTDGSEWPKFIATEKAIAAIKDMAGRQLYKPPTGRQVNEAFRQFCPSARQDQQKTNFGRHRGLALPDLETARAEFAEYIGGEVPW